jgi:hypothetical protein
MKMVSLELPEKSKEEMAECCESLGDGDKYPWGMQLSFEKEQLALLPELSEVTVGDKVMIMCEACVTEVSLRESTRGDKHHSVRVQVEQVAVEQKVEKTIKDMTLKEYSMLRKAGMGDSSGSKELVI